MILFKFSGLPPELRHSVLSYATIPEAVQFTKTDKFLRDYCLKNGPFPKRFEVVDVVFEGNYAKMKLSNHKSVVMINLSSGDRLEILVMDRKDRPYGFDSPYSSRILNNLVHTTKQVIYEVAETRDLDHVEVFFEQYKLFSNLKLISHLSLVASYAEMELLFTHFQPIVTNLIRLHVDRYHKSYREQTNLVRFASKQTHCPLVSVNPRTLHRLWEALSIIGSKLYLFPSPSWDVNNDEMFNDVLSLLLKSPHLRNEQAIVLAASTYIEGLENDESILSRCQVTRHDYRRIFADSVLATLIRSHFLEIEFSRKDNRFLGRSPRCFGLCDDSETLSAQQWAFLDSYYSKAIWEGGHMVLMLRFAIEKPGWERNQRMHKIAILKHFPKLVLS